MAGASDFFKKAAWEVTKKAAKTAATTAAVAAIPYVIGAVVIGAATAGTLFAARKNRKVAEQDNQPKKAGGAADQFNPAADPAAITPPGPGLDTEASQLPPKPRRKQRPGL